MATAALVKLSAYADDAALYGKLGFAHRCGKCHGSQRRRSFAMSGCRREKISMNSLPFRQDWPGHAVEGAVQEFGDQKPCWIDRARHHGAAGRNALEAAPAVIRLVADQDDETVTLGARGLKRAHN